jgi:small multidrug resistance pump
VSNLILLFYVLAASAGLIFVKLGSSDGMPLKFIDSKIHFNLNIYIVAGILLYAVSFILYIYLISKNELGYIIPLTTALVYTLIFFASYAIFNEVFTLAKIAGISLILAGILLLTMNK